ncbi:MAG: hypothetical protein ABEI06_05875, partial [Halobacteriaceae archaeon]
GPFIEIYSGFTAYTSIKKAKRQFDRFPITGGGISVKSFDLGDEAIAYQIGNSLAKAVFRRENVIGIVKYTNERDDQPASISKAIDLAKLMYKDWPQ